MKMFKICIFLALLWMRAEGEEGGLQLQISQKGLDYAGNKALDVFLEHIRDGVIPDQNGRNGRLKWELRNIKLQVAFKPDTQAIFWSLSNVDLKASLDWKYEWYQNRFLNLRHSGSLDITAEGVKVEMHLNLIYDPATGRPRIKTSHGSARITGKLNLDFSGGLSWIYDLLASATESYLTRAFEDELLRCVVRALDQDANEELATLETENTIDSDFIFDFKLVSQPTISSNYITSLHAGCVYRPGHPDCSIRHPSMDADIEGRMLGLSLSEQAIGTWLKAAFHHGNLNVTILHEHLDDEHNHYFETECNSGFCMSSFIPNVATTYPNSKFEVDFITLAVPTLSITPSKLNGHIEALVKVFVRTPDDQRINLFDVKTNATLNLVAQIQGSLLQFKLIDFEPNFEVVNVHMENVSQAGLAWAAKVAGKVLVDMGNRKGEQGIPLLQMRGISMQNSELTFQQDYLHLVSDVLYTRPSK